MRFPRLPKLANAQTIVDDRDRAWTDLEKANDQIAFLEKCNDDLGARIKSVSNLLWRAGFGMAVMTPTGIGALSEAGRLHALIEQHGIELKPEGTDD